MREGARVGPLAVGCDRTGMRRGSSDVGPMLRRNGNVRALLAIKPPSIPESGKPGPPLVPPDSSGKWHFRKPARAGAIAEVAKHVAKPAQQDGFRPIKSSGRARPYRCQSPRLTKAATI